MTDESKSPTKTVPLVTGDVYSNNFFFFNYLINTHIRKHIKNITLIEDSLKFIWRRIIPFFYTVEFKYVITIQVCTGPTGYETEAYA